jgi:hypothetical protein
MPPPTIPIVLGKTTCDRSNANPLCQPPFAASSAWIHPFIDALLDETRDGRGAYWEPKSSENPIFDGAPGRTINDEDGSLSALLPCHYDNNIVHNLGE